MSIFTEGLLSAHTRLVAGDMESIWGVPSLWEARIH